jgi:hypothetical protein
MNCDLASLLLLCEGRILPDSELLDITGTKKRPIIYRLFLGPLPRGVSEPARSTVDPQNFQSLVERLRTSLGVERSVAEDALRRAQYNVDEAAEAILASPAASPPLRASTQPPPRPKVTPITQTVPEELKRLAPAMTTEELMNFYHNVCNSDLRTARELLAE